MAGQAVKKPRQTKKPIKKSRINGMLTQALAYFIVFLAFYIVISLFIAGLIIYSFNDTAKNTEIYSINVVYGNKTLHKLDARSANNEYGLYIPFSYLTEISSFGLAGSGDDLTLFIIGTDNRIECERNSSLIVINDNPVRISAPILYENDDYLIPVILLENYINGIDVAYNEDKMVCSISSDIGKTDVALKLLLPDEMKKSYFPDSYKYYTDVSGTSGNR